MIRQSAAFVNVMRRLNNYAEKYIVEYIRASHTKYCGHPCYGNTRTNFRS